MIREEKKVGEKGQVVIPKVIRDVLGVVPGEKVVFEVIEGRVTVERPKVDVVSIFERIAKTGKSIKEFNADKNYEEMMDERWQKIQKAIKAKKR